MRHGHHSVARAFAFALACVLPAALIAGVIYNPITGWITAPGGATCPTPNRLYSLQEGSGTTVDDTGSDNVDGDLAGGSDTPTWTTEGLTFNSSDYVLMDSRTSVAYWTGPFTVCTAFKTPSLGGRGGLIGEFNGAGWFLTVSNNGSYSTEIFITTAGSTNREIIQWGASPATNTWYFSCIGMPANGEGSNSSVYINGAPTTVGANPTTTLSSALTYGTQELRMGTMQSTGTGFGQTVGWSAIWKTTKLTDDEIEACCVDADTAMGGVLTCP